LCGNVRRAPRRVLSAQVGLGLLPAVGEVGEAEKAREAFRKLMKIDRDDLVAFLASI